ncbi:MAG: hypothetical protein LBJ89_04185 [Holosporales bacterium]|jgi:hypothetical protein|nr:hypothetical protein [Holosporales bacterium]
MDYHPFPTGSEQDILRYVDHDESYGMCINAERKSRKLLNLSWLLIAVILISCNHIPNKTKIDPEFWDHCETKLEKSKQILAADLSDVGQMDYALFLYAFESKDPQRDAKIKAITDKLVAKARVKDSDSLVLLPNDRVSFDGSSESIVNILRIVSACGVVNTHSAFYAIPCAIVKKRPDLLLATEPCFGGNRDNFLPRCGLEYGRGTVSTFPKAVVDHYRKVLIQKTQKAFDLLGSIRHTIWGNLNSIYGLVIFNPSSFMSENPKMDGYIRNIIEHPECRNAFVKAKSELVRYYKNDFGFDAKTSELIARYALVSLVPDPRPYSE